MADIYRMQDPKLSQKDLVEDYKAKWKTNQPQAAQDLVNSTAAEEITMNSNKINPVITKITDLQNSWFQYVDISLNEKENTFQNWVDQLKTNATAWDINQVYPKFSVVINGEKDMYIATEDIPAMTPLTDTRWYHMSIYGPDGYLMLGVKFKGNWSSGANYDQFDIVTYSGTDGGARALYCAKNAITSSTTIPPNDVTNWAMVLDTTKAAITIYHPTAPPISDLYTGQIYGVTEANASGAVEFYYVQGNDEVEYVTSTGNIIETTSNDSTVLGTVNATSNSSSTYVSVDLDGLLDYNDLAAADVGTTWKFKVYMDSSLIGKTWVEYFYGNQPSDFSHRARIYNSLAPMGAISLDWNTYYILTITKDSPSPIYDTGTWEYFSEDTKENVFMNIYCKIPQVRFEPFDSGTIGGNIRGIEAAFDYLKAYYNL